MDNVDPIMQGLDESGIIDDVIDGPQVTQQIVSGEEQQEQQTQQPAAQSEGQGKESLENQESYRYFQSKADKAEAENARLRAILEQQQQQQQYLAEQQRRFSSGDPNGQPSQVPAGGLERASDGSLKRPTQPIKPEGYDAWEAENDPASPSAAYRQRFTAYLEGLATYNEHVATYHSQMLEQQAAQRAQEAQMAGARHQLRSGYQMSDEEVDDFVRVMDSPELLSMENMVKFYRVMKGEQANKSVERRRPTMPLPPVTSSTRGTSAPSDARSDSDKLIDAMLGDQAQQKAW